MPRTVPCWRRCTGHTARSCTRFSVPTGCYVATASADRTARVWDSGTGALRYTLTGHNGIVTGVSFSPDGRLIATSSSDKTARIWNARTGALAETLLGHTRAVEFADLQP